MQQFCTYGSVRGASENRRPYRDKSIGIVRSLTVAARKLFQMNIPFLSRARERAVARFFSR